MSIAARIALASLLIAIVGALAQGIATRGVKPAARSKASGIPFASRLVDIASQAGLTKPSIYGGIDRCDYLVETSSGGVAFLDHNNDGHQDLFFTGGSRFPTAPPEATNRLYHNNGNGTFRDVTEAAGLHRTGWASGVTVADLDNDGFDDLFVTYWGDNVLYRNNRDGTFADITRKANLSTAAARPLWGAGATFLDFNRDGHLDLFVSNYVDYDIAKTPKPGENPNCNWKGVPVACGPRGLKPGRHWLYRNNGDATFTDVSSAAGIAQIRGSFGMTAVSFDVDEDGWPDIYVACDSSPSLLFRNNHDGTFTEEGLERGLALNDDGMEQAGMGIAIGDYNLDGHLDILKTHFADDTHGLFRNNGKGSFLDDTLAAGLGVDVRHVGWGAGMPDLDHDGRPDLFIATGNVYPETESQLPAYPYKTPRLFFCNLGGRFEQLFHQPGPGLAARHSSRGAAFGDIDNDGDLDIAVWNRNEPPSLLRNDLKSARHWLQVKLVGTRSNRSAIGAFVRARYGKSVQAQVVTSQASFYSANDRRLHFGVGDNESVDLDIRWPSGANQLVHGLAVDRLVTITEKE